MSEIKTNALFEFAPGDVSITVMHDGETFTGRVSSHAMALGSPVWEKFLFPPWAAPTETKDSEGRSVQTCPTQQLDFSEDDAEALLILLRIAHLQHKEIPATLPYDRLLNLAVLVDQYDCINLVRPWLATWLANEDEESKLPKHESWLFIAWAFGRKRVFERLALRIVRKLEVGVDGVTCTSSGDPISEPLPHGILESISAVRQATIGEILNLPYSFIARYENTNNTLCRYKTVEGKTCDALVYGSLTRGLQISGLWPRKKAEDVLISIDQLISTIDSLRIYALPDRNFGFYRHGSCSTTNFGQRMTSICLNIPSPALDSHYRHLRAQRALKPAKIRTIESANSLIFRHGDVQIKVVHQGKLIVGEVSSHCMDLASKVWESLKNEKQGTSSRLVKEIDFGTDNGEALLLLLRIAHHQYIDIPTTPVACISFIEVAVQYELPPPLTCSTILEVAVLCDRYNCVELVQPWLSRWLSDEKELSMEARHGSWLFIAWVFGRDEVFSDMAATLVLEVTKDDDGKCLKPSGAEFSEPLPPKILEHIQEIREETIKKLLDVPYGTLAQYEDTNNGGMCSHLVGRVGCDAAIHGCVLRGLQNAGLWPRKQAKDIHMSVKELAKKIENIRIFYYAPTSHYYENHYGCSPHSFSQPLLEILSAIPTPGLESHRQYIEAQE